MPNAFWEKNIPKKSRYGAYNYLRANLFTFSDIPFVSRCLTGLDMFD